MSPVLAAIVIAVVAITIVLAVVMGCFGSKPLSFEGRHVLITGGSTGIGLALAKECVKQGASVTVVARTQSKLDAAVAELKAVAAAANSAGQVGAQSADVTDFEQAQAALAAAAEAQGPIDVLICNAGTSVPGYFHDTGVEVFEAQMKLNFFGVLHCVKAAYSAMVARRSGHICIVSSALGTLGIVGYSAYVPSKYAAKGLADALRNELQGSGVSVSVACPPDTATPGFEHENEVKPPETKAISESGNAVFSPEQVARAMIQGIRARKYILPNPDPLLSLHATLVKGVAPRSFPTVLLEMVVGCVGPLAHCYWVNEVDGVARKFAPSRFERLWGSSSSSAGRSSAATAAATTTAAHSSSAGRKRSTSARSK